MHGARFLVNEAMLSGRNATTTDHCTLVVQRCQAAAVLPQIDSDHRNPHGQLLFSGCPPGVAPVWWRGGPFHKSLRASEQDEADEVAQARETWRADMSAIPAERLVFLDASGALTNLVRLHGWSPRGGRAWGTTPCGCWERGTILGALGLEGVVGAMSIAAATDGAVFHADLEQVLLPELRGRPDAVLIMDMCGRPLGSKKNRQAWCGASSGADMCPAFAAASHAAGPYGSPRIGSTSTSRAWGARP